MKGAAHFEGRMRETPGLQPAHLSLFEQAMKFGAEHASIAARETDDAARELVAKLGAAGLIRHIVGKVDLRSASVLRETLAYHHGVIDLAFAMQGLGSYAMALTGAAAPVLAEVASGKAIAAFAVTEANAGSDLAAVETRAEARDGGYVINGTKIFISNAPIADVFTVLARTDPAGGAKGLSMFLVRKTDPGVRCSRRMDVMAYHPIGELSFQDCRIGADRLVGKLNEGYKLALTVLENFRTTVAAAACGMAGRALAEAVDHVQARKQFGKPLADQQMVRGRIADMAVELEAARLLVYRSAAKRDGGAERIPFESASAKLAATETAQRVIDSALQLHGGSGVLKGSAVERLYREIRALRIYEGATDILKLVVSASLLG